MAHLQKIWIEGDNKAMRIDWDNDRHQRVEIEGRNPLQVSKALRSLVRIVEDELYNDKI